MLELHTKRKLDNAGGVHLGRQVLQAAGGTGGAVVRVVKRIEEVSGKTNIEMLFDIEMLVKGEVVVPRARADDVVSWRRIVESTKGCVVARPVRQSHCKLALKGTRAVGAGRPRSRWSESSLDVGCVGDVEVTREPLPIAIAAAWLVQRGALARRNSDIARLDQCVVHTHPQATIP